MSKAAAASVVIHAPDLARIHKIRDARYSVKEGRFIVTLDSGKEYTFHRAAMENDDGTDVVSLKLDRKRYFFRVTQTSGNHYEVPWDRVLHEAEPSYAYFRGRPRAAAKHGELGRMIRDLRQRKGLSQDQLARAAGMVRLDLSRIESGKHRPTLETLERIASALKVPVAGIVVPNE